jgi:uncharacterized protein (DUF4415 family)
MNEKNLNNTSRTDWEALSQMKDDQIDYSDIPPLGKEFFDGAVLRIPVAQARGLVPLDPDVLAWFQAQGADYKSRINAVLRSYMLGK